MWLNDKIKVGNKLLYNRECIENQLIKIGHIYEYGQILDRNMLNIVYEVNLSIMQYNSLISAIPQQWRLHMRNGNNNNQVEQRKDKFTISLLYLSHHKKWCQSWYTKK